MPRKVAFSGKAKKEQLKQKRFKKDAKDSKESISKLFPNEPSEESSSASFSNQRTVLNYQSSKKENMQRNKYCLQFFRESDAEINKRKLLARQTLTVADEKNLEVDVDQYFPSELSFPKRPTWSFEESLDSLNRREHAYFTEYIKKIENHFAITQLGYFELNLETWRQLWRVLEYSDIILVIVDIRFSSLMFPPSLYEFVSENLKKDLILVLNKIDLVPPDLVVAWKAYFLSKYPKLHIIMFTSLPDYNLVGKRTDKKGLNIRKRRGKIQMAAEGTQSLLDVCKEIVGNNVDLSSWQEKINEELNVIDDEDNIAIEQIIETEKNTSYFEHEKYKNGVLTIGCIGQPNVGKSSLMNAIMGKKVVSVSRTPGCTKHFQTIFLTKNVRLCDCPGLVFPSKVPKALQVLMGSFPISQLREPFTTVKYLAEHLNLSRLLGITHPEEDEDWSAMDICNGWAKKRNFFTAKAARLDSYRAANNLLRMALDGKVCLYLRPPGYSQNKETWLNDPNVEIVYKILGKVPNTSCTPNLKNKDTSSGNSDVTSLDSDERDSDSEEITNVFNKFSLLKNN